jgi:PKD repeat protein
MTGIKPKVWILGFIAILSIVGIACEGETISITRATTTPDPNAIDQPAPTASTDGSTVTAVPVDSTVDPNSGPTATSMPSSGDPSPTSNPGSTPSPGSTPQPTTVPIATVAAIPTPGPTSTPVPPAPSASFDADARTGEAPFEVTFTPKVNGTVNSFEWDFGDGNTSIDPSPIHQYTLAGNHTVSLTVAGPGGSDTETVISYVVVDPGPIVNFDINPDFASIEVNESLQFSAIGSDAYGNEITVAAEWASEGVDGSIDATGTFRSGTTADPVGGSITANIQFGGEQVAAIASVVVTPGPVSALDLSPSDSSVAVQEIIRYTLSAEDEFGNEINNYIVTWDAIGAVGSLSSDGELTAGTLAGEYPDAVSVTVVSGTGSASASSNVTIAPDVLAKVSITPESSSLVWGASETFSAVAEDRFGNTIPNLAFAWSATGGDVDQSGSYTAGNKVGSFALEASAISGVEVAGTAFIDIPTPEFFYQREIGGSFPPGTLRRPHGIAIDSQDNIYVVETNDGRISKFTPDNVFLSSWGSQGTGSGQFSFPYGIAIGPQDDVYVADTENHRIQKFTSDGELLLSWGSFGSGDSQFKSPWDVAVDGDGNVYVLDTFNHRVQKFNSVGVFINKWGSLGDAAGLFSSPHAIAVAPAGDVYVSDRNTHRIQRFTNNGAFMLQFGSFGTGDGQFKWPEQGLAIDSAGNVYVGDDSWEGADDRIQKFTANGAYLTQWGTYGSDAGTFDQPMGIAINSEGSIYVADDLNDRIQVFNSNGSYIEQFGKPDINTGTLRNITRVTADSVGNIFVTGIGSSRVNKFTADGEFVLGWGKKGNGQGEFTGIRGVAVDDDGNVYIADFGNNRIQKFNNFGSFITEWGSFGTGNGQFDRPNGIAIDDSGLVYVTDRFNHRIQVFTDSGSFVRTWGTNGQNVGQFSAPTGIAIDPDGNVFVADDGNNRVQKFTKEGVFITTWGSGGSDLGRYDSPSDIVTDRFGNVYVVEENNHRVQVSDGDGNFLLVFGEFGTEPGEFNGPFGIGITPDGKLLIADSQNGRVQIFTSPAVTTE